MLEYEFVIFEWDDQKNRSNRLKHGISFEAAHHVFFDEHCLTEFHRIENGDERWKTLGLLGGEVVVFIGHLVAEDAAGREVIRLITARKADPKEREEYYANYP
jgi:uncharacterized DUF497 family protein